MSAHEIRRLPPYRRLPVLHGLPQVELAHCAWCSFLYGSRCTHPRNGGDTWRREANPTGDCAHWSASWLTRLARALRLGRARIMADL